MKSALILVLLAGGLYAQEPTAGPQSAPVTGPPTTVSPAGATLTIPAKTRVLLVLVRPVSTRTTKVGDQVYLQTSVPVTIGDKLAIPAGTSVEGTLEKAVHASLSKRRADIPLRNVSLIYPGGYKVSVPGSVDLTDNLENSTSTYGDSGNAAPLAALGAAAGGTAIGALAEGVKGAAVGGAIGGVVGFAIALPLILHRGGVFMDTGTAVDMVLANPVIVDQEHVLSAATQPVPRLIVPPPVVQRQCYDPGTPGTPDTVIPGAPGTPDTVIPGTPATPGQYYPCPPR